MIEVRCPDEWHGGNLWAARGLFLGGGISGCPPWQSEMLELLKDAEGIVVINPRRDDFDITDPEMTVEQIRWEHHYLERCYARLFWFPCETLCPITLFELGKYCTKTEALFVGCHPDYKRKLDIQYQIKLARPWNPEISLSLEDLAARVKNWANRKV